MTPGTAAAKKKNVTFGDHVVDNQEKRPLKSGLPDDCPGKFPSPWSKTMDAERDLPAEKGRGRNKLTEALEQARDESRQRKGQSGQQLDEDRRPGSTDDENACCVHWRDEYEVYRTNTQREVKKLVKKYKAAKDYAQSKDDEASDLRIHLQEAEAKADALEEAVNLLTSQIKDLEEKLRAQHQPQQQTETLVPTVKKEAERERPRDLLALLERRGSKERTVSSSTIKTTENDQLQRPTELRPMSSRGKQEPNSHLQKAERSTVSEKPMLGPEQALESRDAKTATPDESPPVARKPPATIAARRAAVKEVTLPANQPSIRSTRPLRARGQAEVPAVPMEKKAEEREEAHDGASDLTVAKRISPLPPPKDNLQLPSEPAVYSPPQTTKPTTYHAPTVATVDDEDDAPPPPPRHASGTIPRTRPQRQDSGLGRAGTLKPMSANARSGSSGNIGRDGKEIDSARLEAAKARIKARGRGVS